MKIPLGCPILKSAELIQYMDNIFAVLLAFAFCKAVNLLQILGCDGAKLYDRFHLYIIENIVWLYALFAAGFQAIGFSALYNAVLSVSELGFSAADVSEGCLSMRRYFSV